MRKHTIAPVFLVAFMLAGCKTDFPVPGEQFSSEDRTRAIEGFVWLDLNADGIASPDEPRISGVTVDLVFPDSGENTINAEAVPTDDKGEYRIVWGVGDDFSVRFTLPKNYAEHTFTKRDIGAENTDSDVNPAGETDFFTLTENFSTLLSAGILPVAPDPLSSVIGIDDALDDCFVRGQADKQACEGDIHRCEVTQDPATFQYSFSCTLGPVNGYSQFDFYIALDLDSDATTGKNEGQAAGVDAELYLNGEESRIQINRYDAAGNYLRGDVIAPDVAVPVFGSEGGDEIGILLAQLHEDVSQLFEQGAQVSFVLVTYPPSGGQLIDDTVVLPERITFNGLE